MVVGVHAIRSLNNWNRNLKHPRGRERSCAFVGWSVRGVSLSCFFCGHGSLYRRMEKTEVQLTELPHALANNLTRYSVVVIIIHNFTLDKILMYRPIILSVFCNFSCFFLFILVSEKPHSMSFNKVMYPTTSFRLGSRIKNDHFPVMGIYGVLGMFPREISNFNRLKVPFSWVFKSYRQAFSIF